MVRIEDRSKGGLVLTRHKRQRLRLRVGGVTIWVEVDDIRRDKVRLRIDAPPSVEVLREELLGPPGASPGGRADGTQGGG